MARAFAELADVESLRDLSEHDLHKLEDWLSRILLRNWELSLVREQPGGD